MELMKRGRKMFDEMFQDVENDSMEYGVRLACADESVFAALAQYYSHVEEGEPLCNMPVRQFYPELEPENEPSVYTREVPWRNTMLISDVQATGIPLEILREQDVICIYRTGSEEDFASCAEGLTAQQEEDGDGIRPAVFCFADAAAAKAYVCGSGVWAPSSSQVVGTNLDDILPLLASTKGDIRYISGKTLLWEEMPAVDRSVQGVQLICRGPKDLSMFEVMEKAEAIAACFSEGVNILWQIEIYEKREILAFFVREMPHMGA